MRGRPGRSSLWATGHSLHLRMDVNRSLESGPRGEAASSCKALELGVQGKQTRRTSNPVLAEQKGPRRPCKLHRTLDLGRWEN